MVEEPYPHDDEAEEGQENKDEDADGVQVRTCAAVLK